MLSLSTRQNSRICDQSLISRSLIPVSCHSILQFYCSCVFSRRSSVKRGLPTAPFIIELSSKKRIMSIFLTKTTNYNNPLRKISVSCLSFSLLSAYVLENSSWICFEKKNYDRMQFEQIYRCINVLWDMKMILAPFGW